MSVQNQLDMDFEELLEAVNNLPTDQFLRFKKELNTRKGTQEKISVEANEEDLETFLLRGPTFSDEQVRVIEETQKAVNRWRVK